MQTGIKRLYWLDILRGLAALSIVLWHWQHFFIKGYFEDELAHKVIYDPSRYPLYHLLRPFYGQGWRAVQLFFTLSGFIFFWLYSIKIEQKDISLGKYLMLRITRLFPLHWVTLAVVILAQFYIHKINGSYFVYNDFSITTFIGNLTLTQNWFSTKFAFNGPSWSISVEMFLYLVFFTACFLKVNKWWFSLIFIVIGYFLRGTIADQSGTGLMSFFAGGIVYYIFNWCRVNMRSFWQVICCLALLPGAILLSILWKYSLHKDLPFYFFEFCLFPIIIFSIALFESAVGAGTVGKKLSFIGDISFSSYLWHFPLQIIFAIVVDKTGMGRDVFYSPKTLGLFYIVLITVSLLSYHYFERPAQVYLRKQWDKLNTGFNYSRSKTN